MYNSIKKKKCKCGTKENPCKFYPTLGFSGFYKHHAPEDVKEKAGTKTQLARKKKNARLSAALKIRKDAYSEDKEKLHLWHLARRYEAKGVCSCGCGQPSSKNSQNRFKWSNCHILSKSNFESVKFHPMNCVELNENCHQDFDNLGSDRWPNLKCWPEIVRKFKILYPLIAPKEYQFLPQILLDTLNK